MASKMSRESAMLMASNPSSRNGGIGRISSRIVPNKPTTSKTSPFLNSFDRLDFFALVCAMLHVYSTKLCSR